MMAGMVFGGIASLAVGTLYALDSNDFVGASVYGSLAGLAIGVPLGLLGGFMGRSEAMMAAPMGGLMGAMLGVMVRFYDVKLFITFFTAVIAVMLAEMAYFTYKQANARKPESMELAFAGVIILGLVFASTLISIPVSAQAAKPLLGKIIADDPIAELKQEAVVPAAGDAGVQEVLIKLEPLGYEPASLKLKAGVPTRLKLEADANAGCTRAFTIRKLGVRKIVAAGGSDVVEIPAQRPGRLQFACSMGMAGGTIEFS